MKITFLGTGSSLGIPVIACNCAVCKSDDHRDKRLRSSILIETGGMNIIIDIAPDFRHQMLRENVMVLNAILLTHEHRDHIGGLDDIRAYNFSQGTAVDCFVSEQVRKSIESTYQYMFVKEKYPGIPELNLKIIDSEPFNIGRQRVIPIFATHYEESGYELPVTGFRMDNFTYLTDMKYISDEELEKLRGSKVLVLSALRKKKHYSHLSLDEAIRIIERVNPEQAYLTHISHMMGLHEKIQKELPAGVFLAWDGLRLSF